ncbi:hypothetical protein GPLA_3145 [Paraglaciecola polaris LMG 21857]|uniref:Uncharacterized protein n=1 Tax=Paraglaciecola polaris LMG 21857 TaxID=1129793 RepID=K6ZD57_9ALTE|nr:hypothetical protein GPLA_3145 [Paraglaciecola polaris LMG 21857]
MDIYVLARLACFIFDCYKTNLKQWVILFTKLKFTVPKNRSEQP